jgi:methyltransferase (TIGR00027 family)
VIDRIAAGRVEQIAMRTRAIDDAIVSAIDAGIEQVVVLGAGLDARAYRMPALRSVRVAELDHPATQRYKRAQLERTRTRHDVRFVPVDFERDGLSEALSAAQFSPEVPTLFLWEGVVMYLSLLAFEATVDALAAFAADGSRLLVTYVAPTPEGVVSTAAERWLLSAIGEPYQRFYEPEAFRKALAERGFVVTEDTGGEQWSQRYQRNREHIDVERLANAVRVRNAPPDAS